MAAGKANEYQALMAMDYMEFMYTLKAKLKNSGHKTAAEKRQEWLNS